MSTIGSSNNENSAPVDRAIRLVCVADADGVRVTSRSRLAKVVPPTESLPDVSSAAGRSGFWVEVRDAADRVRYRRVMADPLPSRLEAPAENGGFGQLPGAPSTGTFTVLVPDLDDGEELVLMRGSGRGAGPATAADRVSGELARISLREEESR